jgi:glutamine amidotransferase
MLAILDYQAGNQTSVKRALDHLALPSSITNEPKIIQDAIGLIFPGVGAAGQAMAHLRETGLVDVIKTWVASKRPFLGICLGCQIMLESSEENSAETLGVLPGTNLRFSEDLADSDGQPIVIPHMGWNTVALTRPNPLWVGVNPDHQFYFVHSYYPCPPEEFVLGTTWHGKDFSSVFGYDGLWAVQFHPEKSGPAGLKILENFYRYCREVKHVE